MTNDNFRKPRFRKFIFGLRVHLQKAHVTFVYQGYRVKVKVMVAITLYLQSFCLLACTACVKPSTSLAVREKRKVNVLYTEYFWT